MCLRRIAPCLLLLAALPLTLAARTACAATADRPNIVLLVGDDHGWPYSHFMGDPIVHTPNLDALAAGGTLFTTAQATSSTCVPSLRALLAGIHTDQWDTLREAILGVQGTIDPRTEVVYYWTVPRVLAWRGYLSWEGGKLWEGSYAQAGFTHGMATVTSYVFTSMGDHFGRDGWEDGTALDPLRAFLDTAGDGPFFTWIAPLLPHVPYDAPPEFTSLYDHLGLTVAEASYYANVTWLDALIGAIVAELDARGLRENTLLVYLSDNGVGIDQPLAGEGQGKGTLAELGFRTPLIFNWPGHVPAGAVRDDLVSELDVPATILDYAGADPIPAGHGRSLKDAIQTGAAVGHDRLVSHYTGNHTDNTGYYVRTPLWRYVAAEDATEEIFAIASDPFETLDVAALHPDLLPGFRTDVVDWEAELAQAPDELTAAGRLTGPDGAPLGGEQLQLAGRSNAGVKLRLSALTAENGDFRFLAVPHGSYKLRTQRRAVLTYGHVTSDTVGVPIPFGGLDSYLPLFAASAPATRQTAGSATIRGTLRDASGRPIAGGTVVLRSRAAPSLNVVVRTAADGRYRGENLVAGTYRITATAGPRMSHPRTRVELAPGGAVTVDLTASAL